MSVVLKTPVTEKRLARETLATTESGSRCIVQVETCRHAGGVRLLVVTGVDLIWTQRCDTKKEALEIGQQKVADELARTAVPTF